MGNRTRQLISNWIYRNDVELLYNSHKKSQDYYIVQLLFATMFGILTGGIFLPGFAVSLGASDQTIGFIGLIPSVVGIFMVFSGFILERFRNRKQLVIRLNIIAKLFICSIVLVPVVVPKPLQMAVTIFILMIGYTLQAFNGVAINIWFMSVVPDNIRGRYFAVRQTAALVISALLPIIAGLLMDHIGNQYIGFVILYILAIFALLGENKAYKEIEEPEVQTAAKKDIKLLDVWTVPIKNKEFLGYTFTLAILYILIFISCTFTSVYMLRYLKLSYTFITAMGIFNAVMQMLFYRFWGRIADQYGHEYVMHAGIWFMVGELTIWAIMPKSAVLFLLPVANLFSAIGNSGFAMGVFNRRFAIIPQTGRSLYEGFFGTLTGLAILISPFIGGWMRNRISTISFVHQHIPFGEFRVMYAITVLGIICLQVFRILRNRRKTKQIKEVITG